MAAAVLSAFVSLTLATIALWGRIESRFSDIESSQAVMAERQGVTAERLRKIEDRLDRWSAVSSTHVTARKSEQ
jgi:hypothetical protein